MAGQPARGGWHWRRGQGAAFTPGRAARRAGCAQPSLARRPAGGWSGGPRPGVRSGTREAPVRPGSTGSPRCWGGGERALHAAPFVPRAADTSGARRPGPASAAPRPRPQPMPRSRSQLLRRRRRRALLALQGLGARRAVGTARVRSAPNSACPAAAPSALQGPPRVLPARSPSCGRISPADAEVRRLRAPAPSWAGRGRARRAPRPPPRSPPRGARAASLARTACSSPTRARAPSHPPPPFGPPPSSRPLAVPAVTSGRGAAGPLELIGGRAGDVRPEGASRGAGAARDWSGGLGARGEVNWRGSLGQARAAGGGWRGRPRAAGCGGRRAYRRFLPSLAALELVPSLSGAPCAAGGADGGVLPRPSGVELDRSDPDARLPPAWEELFRVCLNFLHLGKDSMRLRSSVQGPAGTRPCF